MLSVTFNSLNNYVKQITDPCKLSQYSMSKVIHMLLFSFWILLKFVTVNFKYDLTTTVIPSSIHSSILLDKYFTPSPFLFNVQRVLLCCHLTRSEKQSGKNSHKLPPASDSYSLHIDSFPPQGLLCSPLRQTFTVSTTCYCHLSIQGHPSGSCFFSL